MPYHLTTQPQAVAARPAPMPAEPAARPAAAPPAAPGSLDGFGDISQAGQPTAYAHLRGRDLPTIGRLMAAAREAARAVAGAGRWPAPENGWWQVPCSWSATAGARVVAAALRPNGFLALPAGREGQPLAGGLLYLPHGRAHMLTLSRHGQLLAVREIAAQRGRVLPAPATCQLLNTGTETSVVVYATA